MDLTSTLFDSVLQLLAQGLWASAGGWTVLGVTLLMTHVTICSVTIFLHRADRKTHV